jgi:hypothetical protein
MTNRKTVFSPCRTWRYTLWRGWGGLFDDGRYVQFIGLNPSTADERQDDPTIRRCMEYARSWGYDSMCMTNLFGFRATDPKVMKRHAEPVGADNDKLLVEVASSASLVIAAWGAHGVHQDRADRVLKLMPAKVHCLAVTKGGHPGHPLYLRKDLKPIEINEARNASIE